MFDASTSSILTGIYVWVSFNDRSWSWINSWHLNRCMECPFEPYKHSLHPLIGHTNCETGHSACMNSQNTYGHCLTLALNIHIQTAVVPQVPHHLSPLPHHLSPLPHHLSPLPHHLPPHPQYLHSQLQHHHHHPSLSQQHVMGL